MYEWEPIEESYYDGSVGAEMTVGAHYDMLRVERTNEGWHGILMAWWDPDPEVGYDPIILGADFVMVDEQVFDSQDEAEDWCERRDKAKAPLEVMV